LLSLKGVERFFEVPQFIARKDSNFYTTAQKFEDI